VEKTIERREEERSGKNSWRRFTRKGGVYVSNLPGRHGGREDGAENKEDKGRKKKECMKNKWFISI